MSITKTIGKVSITPKNDWNSTDNYNRLDLVKHNGGSYLAKVDNTNVEPSNLTAETWLQIAEKGAIGDPAATADVEAWLDENVTPITSILSIPNYSDSETYSPNNVVLYTTNNKIYRCHTATTAGTLPTDTNYWTEVVVVSIIDDSLTIPNAAADAKKVGDLKSAIGQIENLDFTRSDIGYQIYNDNRMFFSTTPTDNTFPVGTVATCTDTGFKVAWCKYAGPSRQTGTWEQETTATNEYKACLAVKKNDGSDITSLTEEFIKSIVQIKMIPTLVTTISEIQNDISDLQDDTADIQSDIADIQSDIADIQDDIGIDIKPYNVEYESAALIYSSQGRVCVQTNMPIQADGKLKIEYYAGTANATIYLLVLEKSGDDFIVKKVINTTTPSEPGKAVVDMDFNMNRTTTYYIGAFEPTLAVLSNKTDVLGAWGWSDVKASVSIDDTIEITRTLGNFLALLPVVNELKTNVIEEDIAYLQEQIDEIKNPTVIRQMSFSFDDTNSVFKDLTENANVYTSLFENSFLGALKTLHEQYGAKFSCYCFFNVYNDPEKNILDFSLANCTNKFADEFAQNYSWLRFGFHSIDNYTTYGDSITTEQALQDYNDMISELIRITGSVKCIDTCIRTQSFTGNKAQCEAWRDAPCGINGFLTSDYGETGGNENFQNSSGYYLSATQYTRCGYKGRYFDPETELFFFPSNLRMDSTTSANMATYLEKFNTAIRYNRSHMMIMYSHQNQWGADSPNRIENACIWALANGYEFVFPMDKINNAY